MRYGKFPERRNEQGQPLCKWCGAVVPKGRRAFCTQLCAHEVQLRRDSWYLRRQVFERDKGICAQCGCDTEKVERVLRYAASSYYNMPCYERGGLDWLFTRAAGFIYDALDYKSAQTYWEADHIKEVVRGGEPYLDNIQTLCRPCHKQKTKRQAGERAAERRDGRRALLPEHHSTNLTLEIQSAERA